MSEQQPVLCLGEALIDVVVRGDSREEHVGGSLLNVAAGIASLGHPASICAWWGPDERGTRLAQWATSSGVTIVPGTNSAKRTAVAIAQLDAEGRATYEFDLEWEVPPTLDLAPYGHLHTGSIAATLEPGGSAVLDAVRRIKPTATVSYDPNIRPALMVSPEAVVGRVEDIVSLSDLVKVSDEDAALTDSLASAQQGKTDADLVRAVQALCFGIALSGDICGALSGGACLISVCTGKGSEAEETDERFPLMMSELTDWFTRTIGGEYGGIRCDDILARHPDKSACGSIVQRVYSKAVEILDTHGLDPSSGKNA